MLKTNKHHYKQYKRDLVKLYLSYLWSKPHTGTINGLRDGTQFGVPMREELVRVCAGMRGDEVK